MSEPNKEVLAGQAAATWWLKKRPAPDKGYKGDRAALARLRRVGTVSEALTEPAVMELISGIAEETGWRIHPESRWVAPAAVTATTLAFLRKNGARPMAEILGQGDPKRYSGLRFTRLIRAESDGERLTQLGRAARRLRADDVGVQIGLLATDIFRLWRWPDDVRRDWTFQYHQMTAAAPSVQTEKQDEVTP
jgi:CRISPR system Cascade subunit CasB